MTELQSLDEYNAARRSIREQISALRATLLKEPRRMSGIACPECGAELVNTMPWTTFTSLDHSKPPEKRVGCPECEFAGFRLA